MVQPGFNPPDPDEISFPSDDDGDDGGSSPGDELDDQLKNPGQAIADAEQTDTDGGDASGGQDSPTGPGQTGSQRGDNRQRRQSPQDAAVRDSVDRTVRVRERAQDPSEGRVQSGGFPGIVGSVQDFGERFFREGLPTAAQAFLPVGEHGEDARQKVREATQKAQEQGALEGGIAEFLGPPQTQAGAAIEVGLAGLPVAGAAIGKTGGRFALRAGTRRIGRELAEEAAEEGVQIGARKAGREAGEEAGERAFREVFGEAAETGARRGGDDTFSRITSRGRKLVGDAGDEAGGFLSRAGRKLDDAPLGKIGLGGAAAGAGVVGTATLLGLGDDADGGGGDGGQPFDPFDPPDGNGDDDGPGPGPGPGDGGGDGFFILPEGLGGGEGFIGTGIGPGGVGLGFLDRIGEGIGDTLRSLGAPIGQGAGRAIATGGVLLIAAYAAAQVIPALAEAGGSAATGAAKGSLPPRGPDGKFTSGGGS